MKITNTYKVVCIHIKKNHEVVGVKKILVICIMIGCLLLSGCVGNEDGNTTGMSDENSSIDSFTVESDSESTKIADDSMPLEPDSEFISFPDLIIEPIDVPELVFLEYRIFAVLKTDSFYVGARPETYLTDNLPVDMRNVGEYSGWLENSSSSGSLKVTSITLFKYDSEDGFDGLINPLRNRFEEDDDSSIEGWKYGTCNIGVDCFYFTEPTSKDVSITTLRFYTSNHEVVEIVTNGEEDKSIEEAIRIAQIIEEKLD
ncbi:hypothetical protein [Methanolobus bombayensis]|uniref:hypothetical protein n=1 Tax=Methanolobus bombayensis TaxID=38023 RepID=UPI001AE37982|nr:hypothetical protein [Methanolobus bombayensis]MBP1908415.1 hypothetical protein [Methanolobus bombayensis]